jgi:fructokinase
MANVLKLNDDELPKLARMFSLNGPTEKQIDQLAQTFDLQLVALTRGPNGSLLHQKGDGEHEPRRSDCPSRPASVVDTVGAGDSFTATLVLGLLRTMDLDELNILANEVAHYVCSHAGATPSLPAEFARCFSSSSPR